MILATFLKTVMVNLVRYNTSTWFGFTEAVQRENHALSASGVNRGVHTRRIFLCGARKALLLSSFFRAILLIRGK